jgi:hypothetical protein
LPHFGLIDEKLSELDTLLQRSKLHIRCGKRRLLENKTQAGIATLYDALDYALKWYIKTNKQEYLQNKEINVYENNADDLFLILQKSGEIYDDNMIKFFSDFQDLLNLALESDTVNLDVTKLLFDYEELLTQLTVMPFDEKELPPENPSTF